MKLNRIYLDYAATTPVDPAVLKAMEPYYDPSTSSGQVFGNASSVHSFGQQSAKAVDEARVTIARFLNGQPTEIVFTSGATEANNTAIKGTAHCFIVSLLNGSGKTIKQSNNRAMKPHIVTTAIEHPSVLESCRALEQIGLAEVTYVKPQSNGVVKVEDVIGAIKENTVLVSVMSANNEVGTIQPIREIGRAIARLKNSKTQKLKNNLTIKQFNNEIIYPLFHTDATQAVQFLNCRVDKLGVDLMSMSAHKIYGPKGIGALYVKKGTPISRFLDGGAQEFGWRAGTLNTPAMVGFGKAIQLLNGSIVLLFQGQTNLTMKQSNNETMIKLKDALINGIIKTIPNTSVNGDPINRLPNNINIRFNEIDAQTLVMALDQAGIAASAGSACASGGPEPSPVIAAMLGEPAARESVRFTIGKWTTELEIEQTVGILRKLVKRSRAL